MGGKPLGVRLSTARTCSSIFFPHVGCGNSENIHVFMNYFCLLLVVVITYAKNGELSVPLKVNSLSPDYASALQLKLLKNGPSSQLLLKCRKHDLVSVPKGLSIYPNGAMFNRKRKDCFCPGLKNFKTHDTCFHSLISYHFSMTHN